MGSIAKSDMYSSLRARGLLSPTAFLFPSEQTTPGRWPARHRALRGRRQAAPLLQSLCVFLVECRGKLLLESGDRSGERRDREHDVVDGHAQLRFEPTGQALGPRLD